jgi:tyrosinase
VSSGDLYSLEPDDVEPFLRSNLGFRVALSDGSVAKPENVDGLSISIISSDVKVPAGTDKLASWGKVASHLDLL